MIIKEYLQTNISKLLEDKFALNISPDDLLIVNTKKEFQGDYTLTVFPIAGKLKKSPALAAEAIGAALVEADLIAAFEVKQGFLNMSLMPSLWTKSLSQILSTTHFGHQPTKNSTVLVEFSSPNTNKPLHLGHVRNMLLGDSMARILTAVGFTVKKIQVINDRGIAICKSMLAWQLYGENKTPENTGIKGDHFVGDYYVLFEKKFTEEYQLWQNTEKAIEEWNGRKDISLDKSAFFKEFKNIYFNKYSSLGQSAREMLLAWENGDIATVELWKKMNQWVYSGFNTTYDKLGIEFNSTDYESITYLLGKEAVKLGLEKNIFYAKEDGSVWIDLTEAGMDQKVVLRSDGTSVYITQDLGTARMRYDKFKMDKLIYVVADEQDYHFKVLFEIIKRFGETYADGLYHLSYGMVELPEGKMKSRVGNVVDADDLIDEILSDANKMSFERINAEDISKESQAEIINRIALGAIKFFMLKVHPKKRMVFNPSESLDLQGQTGPYVQNAYVRIQSVLKKVGETSFDNFSEYTAIHAEEKEIIQLLESYPQVLKKAATEYDVSEITNYSYLLAKSFHRFYHEIPILRTEDKSALNFRLALCKTVATILQDGFYLLGIKMPERM